MTSDEVAAMGNGTAGRAVPPAIDTSVAHHARIYDYVLGGKDNYAADRKAVEAMRKIYPNVAIAVRANRAFLGRAVRYLAAEAGIRQFLDIGTGIPTAGNTHQVAQAIAPESRVVYVDNDPIVLSHARALMVSNSEGATDYIDSDLRDTGTILAEARHLVDFSKPVAVTMLAILHAIPDADDPHGIVTTLMDAVPAGGYLAISHPGSDLLGRDTVDGLKGITDQMSQPFTYRSREQVARFFAGMDLVEPGLVRLEEWRPDPGKPTPPSAGWCAVGRKREWRRDDQ
jgi:hypothetical protein